MTTFPAGLSCLWPSALLLPNSVEATLEAARSWGHVAVGVLPRVVVCVEGAIGLPDSEDQVEEIAHALPKGNVASFALSSEASVKGADGGIVADGDTRGVPKIAAHQVAAFARHPHRPWRQGVAPAVDPRAILLRKDPKIAHELIGSVEPVDVDDLGNQD